MSTSTASQEPGRHATRLSRADRRNVLSREDAASRITAFVYGNILVMAALIILHPDDLLGPTGIAYVAGTAVSTFLAHLIAESVGLWVRTDTHPAMSTLRHEARDALPIASSAALPAVPMLIALGGRLDTTLALRLAIGVTVVRLASLGWVVSRTRGERASLRTFLAGVLLAVVGTVAAVVKWWLTH
jgi:hypothetical protein